MKQNTQCQIQRTMATLSAALNSDLVFSVGDSVVDPVREDCKALAAFTARLQPIADGISAQWSRDFDIIPFQEMQLRCTLLKNFLHLRKKAGLKH